MKRSGVKNPGNMCLLRVAITFWILRSAQNDSPREVITSDVNLV